MQHDASPTLFPDIDPASGLKIEIKPYTSPTGGWGSVTSLVQHTRHEAAAGALAELVRQNKPDGFACTSCAWAKPAKAHLAEFCENGAKATFAELTSRRVGPEFFARHTLAELRGWPDHDLEHEGRLTEPMRYDPAQDRYVPVSWNEAFADIGRRLAAIGAVDPDATVFYASGRASLETSYMYAMLARLYGTNNLPDSSNMCHESTSVGLKEAIGQPVGTVRIEDFDHTDCFVFFGQNVGSNSPRMLHLLQAASQRDVPIIVFNPLRERGLEYFASPQNPLQMATGSSTRIATQYLQVRPGGDIAAMAGLCKALLETGAGGIDTAFLAEHTHGFDDFASFVRGLEWSTIESEAGLAQADLREAARVIGASKAVMGVYGMGLTQHKLGVDNVRMLTNLLLLGGNIGKPGAGLCPVRGHSNVQGQRTVGISEKPELVPLDKLAEQYGFEPPRKKGLNTVEACEGVLDGSVKAFIGLGGNFIRAVPDHHRIEPAWTNLELTIQIATKLNRSHLVNGKVAYLLPCLGRIERDVQMGGEQTVTVEDSTARIHASRGHHAPASKHLLSEPRIVAGIAKATLAPNPKIDWDTWAADYARVRNDIEETYPEDFRDFNQRMHQPGGFPRPLSANERKWKTKSGKAEFKVPSALCAAFEGDGGTDVLRLMTMRSNDQFNTTIYGYDDRLRGIQGTREVLLMHVADIARLGFVEGQVVTLASAAGDGVVREVRGLRVTAFNLPEGSCGAYYPECNPVMPLYQYAEESFVPAAKSVPVRVKA
ncbi:MAG: FdhF/YdeP family oxidoreductase [Variovorax sp.]|nr:MAG: FdhF/YdeP family oxidoreductase [Variovorax sp.]